MNKGQEYISNLRKDNTIIAIAGTQDQVSIVIYKDGNNVTHTIEIDNDDAEILSHARQPRSTHPGINPYLHTTTDTLKKEISTKLNDRFGSGTYCRTLFDPIQTHAIYGVRKDDQQSVKDALKSMGAKRFRTVNATAKSRVIICFDAKGIN